MCRTLNVVLRRHPLPAQPLIDGYRLAVGTERHELSSPFANSTGAVLAASGKSPARVADHRMKQDSSSGKLVMLLNVVRTSGHARSILASQNTLSLRRGFSVISAHTSFPASLYRFQPERTSGLFTYKEGGAIDDGLEVLTEGMVYSRVSDHVPFSNGAVFMPNTFTMQERIRTAYDNYIDGLEDRKSSSDAIDLRIRKGTDMPSALTLLRERSSRFLLQPSRPTNVKGRSHDDSYAERADSMQI